MNEECSEEKHKAINEIAVKQLQLLFSELEEAIHDKDLLEQYEIDFLGDLYARMIIATYMGYDPGQMGEDAIEGTNRLINLAKEHEEKVDV